MVRFLLLNKSIMKNLLKVPANSLLHFKKAQINGFMFSSVQKRNKYHKSNLNTYTQENFQGDSSNMNLLEENIGVIGYGNMSGALVKGFLNSGVTEPEKLFVSERHEEKRNILEEQGITNVVGDTLQDEQLTQMMKFSDIILVGVKPQGIQPVLDKIATKIEDRHLVISIAAGITLQNLHHHLGEKTRIIRVMPNTPCLVGNGVSAYAPGKYATQEDKQVVQRLLSEVGVVVQIQQKDIHAIVGISGSAPAYVFMMIEAMADGGVKVGLSRENALRLAAKTVEGAAKMVLQTTPGQLTHPAILKDRVASPGGSTIAAIEKLEEMGMRNAFIQAVSAAEQKSRKMEEDARKDK